MLVLVSYNFCMIPLLCPQNFGYSDPVDRGVCITNSYSRYRDYLKNDAFKYMDELSGKEEFTLVYDKWNTANEDEGECTFGSGHNQMTMTYISFTGWLRSPLMLGHWMLKC